VFLITSPQIFELGTINVWLSKVRIVVETRLMLVTPPNTPPASMKSSIRIMFSSSPLVSNPGRLRSVAGVCKNTPIWEEFISNYKLVATMLLTITSTATHSC
jgi:hypothetical protein